MITVIIRNIILITIKVHANGDTSQMRILIDESAQISAELILILGGIIVIALIALVTYNNYVKGFNGNAFNGSNNNSQLNNTTTELQNLNTTVQTQT